MTTRWVVFTGHWYECLTEGLPFLGQPNDLRVVLDSATYEGPPPGHEDIVLGPCRTSQLAPVFEMHARRMWLYETENLLGSARRRELSQALRLACPSVRWLNYSRANAEVFSDTFKPLTTSAGRRPQAPRAYDVLFVGSDCQRRSDVVVALRRAGAKVKVVDPSQPVFGLQLAALYAECRLVLNVHYYVPGVFESFRVIPALARGIPVISETSVAGEGAEWCPCHPYTDLVGKTMEFLKGTRPDR